MTNYCSGKQGAAFYLHNSTWMDGGNLRGYPPKVEVYLPSRDLNNPPKWGLGENTSNTDLIILFESTPIRVERREVTPPGYATWRVYTRAHNGIIYDRGVHGKTHDKWFIVTNTWEPSRKIYISRLTLNTSPLGSLRSWSASGASSFSHQVFASGEPPVTNHVISITSAEGFLAYEFWRTGTSLDFSVHCGCENGNCQQGTFPLKYCCFSCSDVNRWLREIRDDSEREKHLIQDKLGLPRTFNR